MWKQNSAGIDTQQSLYVIIALSLLYTALHICFDAACLEQVADCLLLQ